MNRIKQFDSTEALQRLRACMEQGIQVGAKGLDALIVPSHDAHLSYYLLANQDKRLEYISGFTGGNGTAVVTHTKASMWVVGSWHDQAELELDSNWELMKDGLGNTPTISTWLCCNLQSPSVVGINPAFCSIQQWKNLKKELQCQGHTLVGTSEDMVDAMWTKKPNSFCDKVDVVNLEITGDDVVTKLQRCRDAMKRQQVDWLVVSSLGDVAWLLNVRGRDIDHNTVVFAYVVLSHEILHLFIREDLHVFFDHLKNLSIKFHRYNHIYSFIRCNCSNSTVWVTSHSPQSIVRCLPQGALVTTDSPVCLMKAVKNKTEIDGMKKANLFDCVAFCQLFNWMEESMKHNSVTECSAAQKLIELRKHQEGYICSSFDILSAAGLNTSFPHYAPLVLGTDRQITASDIYYNDSGGHYKFGTTDTTRTVHFGQPTDYQKKCFTLVLKGFIAVSTAIFPRGTKGYMLDTLAREHLWKHGMDFPHSTGHGIGHGRSVVEGPAGNHINKGTHLQNVSNDCDLKPGMTITVEPGYYEKGNFGVRIENTLLCVDAKSVPGSLRFETITHVPIQLKMIDVSMLDSHEIEWLNEYHAECMEVLGAELRRQNDRDPAIKWLKKEAKQIAQ